MKRAKTRTLVEIQADVAARLEELRPQMPMIELEVKYLELCMEIIDYKREQIGTNRYAATNEGVDAWLRATFSATDSMRPRDIAEAFQQPSYWGFRQAKRMLAAGKLEQFGRGVYRVPPDKRGEEVRLRAVS